MNLLPNLLDWWAIELFTLLASYVSVNVFAAQTILRGFAMMTCSGSLGYCYATSAFIGIYLGEQNIAAVKHYVRVSMFLALLIGLIQGVILYFTGDMLIQFFSTDETV